VFARGPLTALFALCLVIAACGGAGSGRVIIKLAPTAPASANSAPKTDGQGVVAAATIVPAVTQTPLPPLTLTGTFKLAAAAAVLTDIGTALQSLSTENPKLKFTVQSVTDADAAARSGADLLAVVRYPGGTARDKASVIRRQPLAIMLPMTLSPDDLSAAQLVDLLSGAVTDWSQVGGPRRPVRLAVADPAELASFGGLVGRPETRLSPDARTDAATALLAGADAGTEDAIVVPWAGPRLKSKALRIDGRYPDDPDYPLAVETLLLPQRKETQPAADQLAPALAARLAPIRAGTVSIDAMGDYMLARGVAAKVQKSGPEWPFARVNERLRTSDVRFGNLELSLTDRGVQTRKDYTFRAPPSAAQSLSWAAINVVDVANNHVLDYGAPGLLDTLGTLDRIGILHAGAGADPETAHTPVITEVNGLRIAWLAYVNVPDDGVTGFVARSLEAGPGRPGVAWGTPDAIGRDVTAARQRADLVVVALHAGFEYIDTPNSIQKDLAHAAIDAGAALVLGAHPHVLQGIEYYRGGVIAYSLGNFVFDLDAADRSHIGLPSVLTCILRVTLDVHGVTGLQIYPAIINSTDFRPEPVFGEAAKPVYDRLYRLTDALRSRAP
jgi:poly-gamma-glutamate capsule biosynthesis protein CapA/YwtB (metallophosphatase superfamily)